MKISVFGAGYVVWFAAACLPKKRQRIIAVDVDQKKIEGLKNGIIPIYEPGLKELILRNQSEGRLSFTTDVVEAVEKSLIQFIAVGTCLAKTVLLTCSTFWQLADPLANI